MIALITEVADLDAIALSLASMIGLALGVDYSLLIVTRFREALDDGLQPSGRRRRSPPTPPGRTAIFAGVVLVAIMLVSFFLSPGSVLLSSAVGAIVVTLLSMVGAALVAPAAVTLLGHRVNKWQIGGGATRRPTRAGVIAPARAARSAAARRWRPRRCWPALLLVAAPVLAIETIPPDPRQLPEDSAGARGLPARSATPASGRTIDIVLRDADAARSPTRSGCGRSSGSSGGSRGCRTSKTVVGPGTIGEQTKELRDAPRRDQARQAPAPARASASWRGSRAAWATRPTASAELRDGLLAGADAASRSWRAGPSRRARAPASWRAAPSAPTTAPSSSPPGPRRASRGAGSLQAGLDEADDGAGRLADGATEARQGSEQLGGRQRDAARRAARRARAGRRPAGRRPAPGPGRR